MENRQRIYIRDPLNYAKDSLLLSYPTYFIISHFDGRHSTLDIQEAFVRQFGDVLSSDKIRELAEQLDQYYYLDSERFARLQQEILEAFRRSPVREMAHADTCYSSQAEEFTNQLTAFFNRNSIGSKPISRVQSVKFKLGDDLGGLRVGDDARVGGFNVGSVVAVEPVNLDAGQEPGLIVKPRLGDQFTIAYGEILTAERLRNGAGLLLHTRTADGVRVSCAGPTIILAHRLRHAKPAAPA